ncbi:MAG: M48 family metallopeptidase [Dysgonamonadaceae bacterium]|jgi:predicted metal-dependent hydrolase|nr:M48 family metallopeptidase [Dysgonamonadaceae bacterium]
MNDYIINDTDLGTVLFRYNPRAKRYIVRVRRQQVTVTVPYRGNFDFAERFFRENRQKVIHQFQSLQETNPLSPKLSDAVLREQAKEYLPNALNRLAQQYGFEYREVKIRKSKTRWGSCSRNRTINLSIYLMLLPRHLIEYVMLHELCHTIEMNHGPAFWNLLEQYTQGKNQALRKELKGFSIRIP